MGLPLIGSIAAPIISGLAGQAAAGGAREEANDAYNRALQTLAGVRVPTVQEQQISLLAPQLVGQYAPELLQTPETMGPTQLSSIQIDPRLREAQSKALQSLSELGEGGLNAQDRAMLNEINRQTAASSQAQQKGILQNLAARGMAGGGQELALKLAANQEAADRASQQGQQLQSMALQRALQATSAAGQLGGQQEQQQYGEAANTARAQDVINQFNLQNRQAQQQSNVGTLNQAQLANLQQRQAMENQSAQLRNQQEQYNKNVLQQHYQNELNKAQAIAGQNQQQGARATQRAGDIGSMYGQIGGAVGSGFANYGLQQSLGDLVKKKATNNQDLTQAILDATKV